MWCRRPPVAVGQPAPHYRQTVGHDGYLMLSWLRRFAGAIKHLLTTKDGETYAPYRVYWCLAALQGLALSAWRSEEHTSELQSLMRISYAVFCLKKNRSMKTNHHHAYHNTTQIA